MTVKNLTCLSTHLVSLASTHREEGYVFLTVHTRTSQWTQYYQLQWSRQSHLPTSGSKGLANCQRPQLKRLNSSSTGESTNTRNSDGKMKTCQRHMHLTSSTSQRTNSTDAAMTPLEGYKTFSKHRASTSGKAAESILPEN